MKLPRFIENLIPGFKIIDVKEWLQHKKIEVYLENDLPLVVKYDVASLGNIRLALVPLPSV